MTSTTKSKRIKIFVILLYLALWQGLSMYLGEEILLPSPLSVFSSLCSLIRQKTFYNSALFTISRIFLGIFLSIVFSISLSSLSSRYYFIKALLDPIVRLFRAVPVASLVILLLVWITSKNLSVLISFMVVFPIMYQGLLKGIEEADGDIKEAFSAYKVSPLKKVRYLYIPYVYPYFLTSLTSSLSLAWKSGIAAEIIALPHASIGERLYMSKVYLKISDLFAWTIVIIFIAFVFEKAIIFFFKRVRDLSV